MRTAYFNLKATVKDGSLYSTGDMYIANGKAGGWMVFQHSTVNNDPDKSIVAMPPDDVSYDGNVLRVNGNQIVVDVKARTVTWKSTDWSGTAPLEWLGLEIDGVYVVNEVFPVQPA